MMMTDEVTADAKPAQSSSEQRALRIFIVENHADTRELLVMLLQLSGHEVLSAATMREGLRTIPRASCDVLISDIGLPDGSGWELLEQLGPAAPGYALAVSGYGMNSDRAQSLAAGFRHHLVKPMGPEQLQEFLQEAAAEVAACG